MYEDAIETGESLIVGVGQEDVVFIIPQLESDLRLFCRPNMFGSQFVAFAAAPAMADSVRLTSTASLNVRGGPGTNHAVVANFPRDEVDVALGRNSDGNWIQISSGRVFADLVEITGDIQALVVTSS